MQLRLSHRSGHVLASTIVIAGLICLGLLASITFVVNQHSLVTRAQVWSSALPIAEAGVEEALTHVNYSGTTNFATYGWSLANGAYSRQRTLGHGYYVASISTTAPPVITCTGFARVSPQLNFVARAVRVTTVGTTMHGLITLNGVTMSGGSVIDSFDSCNPLYSTGGFYDPLKATDGAFVGVVKGFSENVNTGTGRIYGRASSGPGGSTKVGSSGGIGTKAWVTANPGGVQPGYFTTDLNVSMPVVGVPFTGGYFTPGAGTNGGIHYDLLLGDGKYQLSEVKLSGSQKMCVAGDAIFYVTGDFSLSGSSFVLITTNASLQLFVGGSKVSASGGGVINSAGKISALTISALSSVTKFDYSGSALFFGSVIAPSADMNISGSGGFSGSAFVNKATMSGGSSFHCDSCLTQGNLKYVVTSWDEL